MTRPRASPRRSPTCSPASAPTGCSGSCGSTPPTTIGQAFGLSSPAAIAAFRKGASTYRRPGLVRSGRGRLDRPRGTGEEGPRMTSTQRLGRHRPDAAARPGGARPDPARLASPPPSCWRPPSRPAPCCTRWRGADGPRRDRAGGPAGRPHRAAQPRPGPTSGCTRTGCRRPTRVPGRSPPPPGSSRTWCSTTAAGWSRSRPASPRPRPVTGRCRWCRSTRTA